MELLRGIADAEEFRNTFFAVASYAIDGKEPDDLSPLGKCIYMTIKKDIMARSRKLRYYHSNKNRQTSKLDANSPSKLDVQNVQIGRSDDLFDMTSNQHMNTDISPSSLYKYKQCSPTDEKPPKRKVFKVPTLEEVRAYISEKGYSIDAEEFFSFYESQGWRVGRNPMKDWHRAVSYWQCRQNQRGKTRTQKRDYSGI